MSEMNGKLDKVVWRVYDTNIVRLLADYGFRYELLAKDIRTDAKFYLYINSESFQVALNECNKKFYGDNKYIKYMK